MPQGAQKKRSNPIPGRAGHKSKSRNQCGSGSGQLQSRCQSRKNKPLPPKPQAHQLPFERASRAIAAQVERDVRGRAEAGGCRPLATSGSDRPRKRPPTTQSAVELDPATAYSSSQSTAPPPNKRARTASDLVALSDSIANSTS